MPKIKKKDIIFNLIDVPANGRRPFWAKEMTFLKRLEGKYPIEFLNVLKFSKKFDSLAILLTGPLAKELESRFFQFNYKPKISSTIIPPEAEKIGGDRIIIHKAKTTKDFLNE
jgi:hypothetical protein